MTYSHHKKYGNYLSEKPDKPAFPPLKASMKEELRKAFYDLNLVICAIQSKAAAAYAERRGAMVAALQGKPAQPGFFYLAKNWKKQAGWLVLRIHQQDPDLVFVVPVWDLPCLEYSYPKQYKVDKHTLIPFTMIGWGDTVANFNHSKWVSRQRIEAKPLVEFLESWKINEILKKLINNT